MGKIFGLGLSKTGTTSLHQAFKRLGLNSVHYPHKKEIFVGDFGWVDGHDAVSDIPVAPYYPQLDKIYPGSKFILTVREVGEWLESMQRWWSQPARVSDYMIRMRIAVYGVHAFHADRLRYVYQKHMKDVTEYFRNRPRDFLVFNICGGEGWEKLCPFLDRPPPGGNFPWVVPGDKK
ncbi:MAG: hypothetical protein A3F90_13395 [Deltaproteobacteria bacterium RIFCSPLOWO2_12_FULL_60_19]|nr:MAG: hypothetical protein A3F90_13395 [Deltaproteobacteria bacterium RIFCSPLOWO2_12_FULL_60_19]